MWALRPKPFPAVSFPNSSYPQVCSLSLWRRGLGLYLRREGHSHTLTKGPPAHCISDLGLSALSQVHPLAHAHIAPAEIFPGPLPWPASQHTLLWPKGFSLRTSNLTTPNLGFSHTPVGTGAGVHMGLAHLAHTSPASQGPAQLQFTDLTLLTFPLLPRAEHRLALGLSPGVSHGSVAASDQGLLTIAHGAKTNKQPPS